MTDDVCTAVITGIASGGPDTAAASTGAGLASTGATGVIWLLAAAAILVAAGTMIAAARRRHANRRGFSGPAALLVLALLTGAASAVGPTGGSSAHAADGPEVSYSDGCRLIAVTDIRVGSASTSLLPGDHVEALTATVTNRTSQAVDLAVAATLAHPAAGLATSVSIDAEPVAATTLASAGIVPIRITVTLPATATNASAGQVSALTVTIHASQR